MNAEHAKLAADLVEGVVIGMLKDHFEMPAELMPVVEALVGTIAGAFINLARLADAAEEIARVQLEQSRPSYRIDFAPGEVSPLAAK